jgi:hypothetical protein
LEVAVHEYEYRIPVAEGSSTIITVETQLNPGAAIRSANRMARGRPFEVWCGPELITDTRRLASLPPAVFPRG